MKTPNVNAMSLPVWVTRPESQIEIIESELAALGCDVILQPMLKIEAIEETPTIRSQFMNIDAFDVVIAISRNAAEAGLAQLDQYWPLGQYTISGPLGVTWVAIGPVTAEVMKSQGLEVEMPEGQFDSEGALKLKSLQNVAGKKILIWRGVGGRETLAQTLRERGAEVVYSELYQRLVPEYNEAQWQQTFSKNPLLLVSSGQGLEAIASQQPKISENVRGIIAPSHRVAELAKSLGFKRIYIADSAQDSDMLVAVKSWIKQESTLN